jgi:hypothetical protein
VPPYYAMIRNQELCSDPWAGAGFTSDQCGEGCPSGGFGGPPPCGAQPWSVGLGGELDNTSYAQGGGNGVDQGQIFQAMACHQRIYSDLIQAFPAIANPTGSVIPLFQKAYQNGATGHNATSAATPPPGGPWNQSIPIDYYDQMAMYEQGTPGNPTPNWLTTTFFPDSSNRTPEGNISTDSHGAAIGPSAWNNASFALVYEWDDPQPNTANFKTAGDFTPLIGCTQASEPGY